MGIYGYEYTPFKNYLSQQSNYLFDFVFPEGVLPDVNLKTMQGLNLFTQKRVERMLFIYGELDSWSATAVELSSEAKDRGLKKFVLPGGHHNTRINDFEREERQHIVQAIKGWIMDSVAIEATPLILSS